MIEGFFAGAICFLILVELAGLAHPSQMAEHAVPDAFSLALLPLRLALLAACGLLCVVWSLNVLWAVPVALIVSYFDRDHTLSPMTSDLTDKHVMVTGGSSGIGEAAAKLFAACGAHVTIVARNVAKLEAAVEGIKASAKSDKQRIAFRSVDMTLPDAEVGKALGSAAEDVDVLVCSAGDTAPSEFEDIDGPTTERLFRTNCLGLIATVRAVLPGMKERHGGRICLISSIAGQTSVFGYTVYSATKFALRGFVEALRQEVMPYKIGVSLVYPPDTDTPMLERENEIKPVECKRISGAASTFTAEAVAEAILPGVSQLGWGHWASAEKLQAPSL